MILFETLNRRDTMDNSKITFLKKIIILYIFILMLFGNIIFFSLHAQVQAEERVIEKNEVEGGGPGFSIFDNYNLAQSFIASGNYFLTKVSLYVIDDVPINNFLTVELYYNDDAGTPFIPEDDVPDTPIGPIASNNGLDNRYNWLDFSLSYPLTEGEKYWVVASSEGSDGEGYRWRDSGGDFYFEGHIALKGEPDWIVDNSNDLMFRVYGIVDNDVGVEEIIAPKHQELYRETNVTATIKNYGSNPQSGFDVKCVITDPFGTIIMDDIQWVSFLDTDETVNLTWFFIPDIEGIYSIEVTTLLIPDDYNENDFGWMEIYVKAPAVLKLHNDILVDGFSNDWRGNGLVKEDFWNTSRREYIWKDAFGDDTGDGDYTYPNDPRFEPGCLDLLEFRVAVDSNSINFLLIFRSIDDGSGDGTDGNLGFSEQIIEILIDTDCDKTGRDDTIRNARLKLDKDIGWEYAIWVDGWDNGYVEDEFGSIWDVVNARGSPLSNAVEISIPITTQSLPDFESWRYVVLIGAQDNNSLPCEIGGSKSGFMRVDEFASPLGGGGGLDLNGADSNVYDLAFASPQIPQLDNYEYIDNMFASFDNMMGLSGGNIDGIEGWAQSFVAPYTCLLSCVDIYAKDIGDDSMTMGIFLTTNDGHDDMDPLNDVPSATIISSTEYLDFNFSYEWGKILFSDPSLIRKGEIYWIVAIGFDIPGEGYQWAKKGGNPWPGGTSARYSGGHWTQENDDMVFRAYCKDLTTVDAHQSIYFAPLLIDELYVNGSADSEWVSIYYNGTSIAMDLDMSNWILTDQDGNFFQFDGFVLSNKNSVIVHSGFGTNTTADLFWGRSAEVWDDNGDDVLLCSNFIEPVDFINYTNGNIFGNKPPIGLNWGPATNEQIPKNPLDLQTLTLRFFGIDNDLYSDWEINALGRIEDKTLYFHDDGSLDGSDPYDFMNTTLPTQTIVIDFDMDSWPGLTLLRSGPPSDPDRYQEFNLTPVLAKNFTIADDVVVDLWLDDDGGNDWEAVKITLFDYGQTSKAQIASQSETFFTDKISAMTGSSGWELVTVTIPDVDYTLEKGHYLILHVMADTSSSNDLWLAYNATSYASCIRTLPTRTFVNVDWANTFDLAENEKFDFMQNEEVVIKANISDPLGSYDISGANITIISPGEPVIFFETKMNLEKTDLSDPSGWKLFNFTYLNTSKPGIYTVNIKGIESNGVTHIITIYFNVLSNTPPHLSDPSLIPTIGYASTSFNFTINYTDIENNPPDVITVNITGFGIYDMLSIDPGDSEFRDGKLYYINLTGFINGTSYSYHFAANDSESLWNETSELLGPTILNTPPAFSDPGLVPSIGNVSTSFNFTINYTDIDNQMPAAITVNISGPSHSGSWSMIEVDPNDTDYTDGKFYYYNYMGFINGSYSHHFAAKDTQDAWSETTEYPTPQVVNTPPVLINPLVLPTLGYITTEFNYTVTYMDLDNQPPSTITVNITGPSHSGSWAMIEMNPLDTNYIDGKNYYYKYTGLIIGSYTFHCAASDSQGAWEETSEIPGPDVLNTHPTLSDHNLQPTVGTAGSTIFNYTVIYTDLDNQAPGNITVNITGPFSGNYTMLELDPSDMDHTDGKDYYFTITLPLDGNYAYQIDANDTGGLWAIGIMDSGPNVGSSAPVLSQPKVSPSIGITTTWFNFTVNFTDLQNDSAGVITLNLSGPSGGLFTMFEVNPSDTNTTDGKFFYYNLTGLIKGIYWFYVQGNDSLGNYAESAVRLVPWVLNSPPQLSGGYINESNFGGSWFNFTLFYLDIDNDSPGTVNVHIQDIGNITMIELDSGDTVYNDGKYYYHNLSIPKGSYLYRFEANDTGFGERWNYTTLNLITLLNNLPIFISQNVTPSTGFGGDFFNFTVDICDFDNDSLEVVLYVSGESGSPFAMQELDTSDNYTLDGKTFFLNLSLVKGNYNYNFSVFDGEESNQTFPLSLVVKNNPPIITTSDIIDTAEDSLYYVDYDYIDLDGDIASWDLETNGTWLSIDPNTGILYGTPTNSEVGSYYVNVSVDDKDGGIHYHNFTLNVTNTLPIFTTIPNEFAQEDILHLDDFNCVDDGQGVIIYSINTNATWININSATGILSGFPDNTHVGWYWVNVTVDDGNGGYDSINYTLIVNNTPPLISTTPFGEVIEDSLHIDDFNCDDDYQGNIIYSIKTNATWLSLNPVTGILSGIPDNTHVGWYWVNVTVTDGNGGSDFINYTLTVLNKPPTITTSPTDTAFEDSLHSDDFDCDDDNQGNITYSLLTNATYLSIDFLTGVLSGTPNNTHVGWYWVNVTVYDGNGGKDSVNYTLTIINLPPTITTLPDDIATEDTLHYDDFDCDDDGQGNISYLLFTNASWLNMDSLTGVLTGTPDNSYVGWYWVNVSVNDGNGGIDFINYTLTVEDMNDPPEITTSNLESAEEDTLYSVDYEYEDIDGDIVTWYLQSNASWLSIDPVTGYLNGTPDNSDVGWCWVNVTIDDGRDGIDYKNFTITINNTPPFITNSPIEYAQEDSPHLDDFDCIDDDQGNIVYSLSTNATWLSINSSTGIVSGIPDNTNVGWYWVNVTVSDGNGGMDSKNYTLNVNNSIPLITTNPQENTWEDILYGQDFDCNDDGQGSIIYDLLTNASWLTIDNITGIVSGTPENDNVGSYWVNVTVLDGNGGYDSLNYTLIVNNSIPLITTTPQENAWEDILYEQDFNCNDDGQGSIIYDLLTNASWLIIDNLTGVISGTPDNNDVGSYWVNITVWDGNGGVHSINYTLEVINTNDPPIITTSHVEFIYEDSFYYVDYDFVDIDGNQEEWSIISNATWLYLNPDTGELYGFPSNTYVGSYYVNVTVNDGYGGYDYVNFTLIVNNTQDPPSIPQLLFPEDDSTVNTTFPNFTWNPSIDPDLGDFVVNYTLQYSKTSDFSSNVTTVSGIINATYTPSIPLDDNAIYYWRVEAFDSYGWGSGFQTIYFVFTIDTGYRPPTYIGGLKSASIIMGNNWTIDLDFYFRLGSITEGLSFTSNYEEIIIDQFTHRAIWTPKNESSVLEDVVFTLNDGITNVSSFPIDLTVAKEMPPSSRPLSMWERIFWPWSLIPLVFLIILGGAYAYRKRKERPVVEEAFFISENGRLIAHASVLADEDMDEDILSSMLTGVKDLISDAFVREEEGKEEKGLHKLEFGEKNILMEKGNHFFIAVVFSGVENKVLFSRIRGVIDVIEGRYGDVLDDWDGNMAAFEGAEDIIETLLPFESFSEDDMEKIKDTRKSDKVAEEWSKDMEE